MTIYLVRHGSAGSRNDDDPFDIERHLDDVGRAQAALLVDRLSDRPITHVASSPALRCIETVRPLAGALGLEVVTLDALAEGTDVERSWEAIESLAATGTNAVLSSHGDVIPEVVQRAQRRGMDVPGKSGCAKGSVWALEWGADGFTTGRYERTDPSA